MIRSFPVDGAGRISYGRTEIVKVKHSQKREVKEVESLYCRYNFGYKETVKLQVFHKNYFVVVVVRNCLSHAIISLYCVHIYQVKVITKTAYTEKRLSIVSISLASCVC